MPTWPTSTLGDAPEFRGFSDAPVPNVIAPDVASGSGPRYLRHTDKRRVMTFSYTWSRAQYRQFLTFFEDDIAQGALSFSMTDHLKAETGTFYIYDINGPYGAEHVGPGHLRVEIAFLRDS